MVGKLFVQERPGALDLLGASDARFRDFDIDHRTWFN